MYVRSSPINQSVPENLAVLSYNSWLRFTIRYTSIVRAKHFNGAGSEDDWNKKRWGGGGFPVHNAYNVTHESH